MAKSLSDPVLVFYRLFGVQENSTRSSILDFLLGDAKSLRPRLGRLDRQKLDEYTQSVRTVEQQIQRVRARQADLTKLNVKGPIAPIPVV